MRNARDIWLQVVALTKTLHEISNFGKLPSCIYITQQFHLTAGLPFVIMCVGPDSNKKYCCDRAEVLSFRTFFLWSKLHVCKKLLSFLLRRIHNESLLSTQCSYSLLYFLVSWQFIFCIFFYTQIVIILWYLIIVRKKWISHILDRKLSIEMRFVKTT